MNSRFHLALLRVFTAACVFFPLQHGSWAAANTSPRPILFMPLDDRPVTLQLPQMLAAVAGLPLTVPPRNLIGRYLTPGNPDGLATWMLDTAPGADGIVVSSDMLAYGGLIASRLPGISVSMAIARLRTLETLRAQNPGAYLTVFGTVMRLAPTGVPQLGDAANFFAAGDASNQIAAYANLPDPPKTGADRRVAAQLARDIGPVLAQYLAVRRRDRRVDAYAVGQAADGTVDRLVLGQDDAGPVGLHLRDLKRLGARVDDFAVGDRVSIEPGADELGMALLARTMLHRQRWTPKIAVVYSNPQAARANDRIEFEPVERTVAKLIELCGGAQIPSADGADIVVFVYGHGTSDAQAAAFYNAVIRAQTVGQGTALADLTFIHGSIAEQQIVVPSLIARGLAARLDAFASWNTDANSVGTALAGAIAVASGKRSGTYHEVEHEQFMLDRYIDDYAYRTIVRPRVNAMLSADGIPGTYLLPGTDLRISHAVRAQLWRQALALRKAIYPDAKATGLTVTLPWDRTFEARIDVKLQSGP